MNQAKSRFAAVFAAALALCLVTVDAAEAARRGGGFGSRGARTYDAPAATRTAPQGAAPVQRSMTTPPAKAQAPAPKAASGAPGAAQQPRRGGFLGGLGGGILGGLLLGGLVGAMMGNGFGAGMAGFIAILFQLALVAGVVFLVMKLLRRRSQPAVAAGPSGWPGASVNREPFTPQGGSLGGVPGGFGQVRPAPAPETIIPAAEASVEIGVTGADRDTFERLLMEIQDALGREDYGDLRERTTPEVMGFLAEEMAQNATEGRRNEISGTKLLQADVAEAWREGDRDYATAAMRYEAIDVVRDRSSGALLEGDPDVPVQTTEHWTFVRQAGGPWKLSAIQ